MYIQGIAKVFDSIDPFYIALEKGEVTAGQVIIFRYQGPKGAPGMPEVMICTLSAVPSKLINL